MHFPAEWRSLFSAAGIPQSALDDVESTRTLIDIITNSIDQLEMKSESDSGHGISLSPPSCQHSLDPKPDPFDQPSKPDIFNRPRRPAFEHMRPEVSVHTNRPEVVETTDERSKRHVYDNAPLMLTGKTTGRLAPPDDAFFASIEAVRSANTNTDDLTNTTLTYASTGKASNGSNKRSNEPVPNAGRNTSRSGMKISCVVPPPPPPLPPPVPLPGVELDTRHPAPMPQLESRPGFEPSDLLRQKASLKPTRAEVPEIKQAMQPESGFFINSSDLLQQKQRLRQVGPTEINQLRNLSTVGHDTLNSMADILKKVCVGDFWQE